MKVWSNSILKTAGLPLKTSRLNKRVWSSNKLARRTYQSLAMNQRRSKCQQSLLPKSYQMYTLTSKMPRRKMRLQLWNRNHQLKTKMLIKKLRTFHLNRSWEIYKWSVILEPSCLKERADKTVHRTRAAFTMNKLRPARYKWSNKRANTEPKVRIGRPGHPLRLKLFKIKTRI